MIKKPDWLRIPGNNNENNTITTGILEELELNTVCIEANCPNRTECFSKKTATFLILGTNCTRNCAFCNVSFGTPLPVNKDEPARVAAAVIALGLRYAVITSVTRDDLPDGGAAHFASVIRAVCSTAPDTVIEVLIPDLPDIGAVSDEAPDVVSHNIETVKSLYEYIRPDSDYSRSLNVLKEVSRANPQIHTKSGIMLGLGESRNEVIRTFTDLLNAGCEYLTVGQYLSPSKMHYPVQEYIEPEVFTAYAETAKNMGFRGVVSGPFVRSSYNADKLLTGKSRSV